MSDKALLPRRAALRIMDGVIGDGRLMAELSGPKGPLGKLDGADKARAMRLATEALRGADRADRILGPFLRKRPDLTVHNVLRLAVLEMCSHGAAPHGVVNSAVSLMREGRETGHFTGLVNAVLRKVSELDTDAWDKLPPAKMPKWLRKPLLADFGKAAIMAIEAVQDGVPPLDLTPKNGDATALAERVGGIVLPTGSVRVSDAGQVSALAGYDEGDLGGLLQTGHVETVHSANVAPVIRTQAKPTFGRCPSRINTVNKHGFLVDFHVLMAL